jgi:cell division septation protein DedD
MRHSHDDRQEPALSDARAEDEAYDTPPTGRRGRLRRVAMVGVAALAVFGFGAIVAYGYFTYSDRSGMTPAPLVAADPRPVRVKPERVGGLEVPHTNLSIYDAGQGGGRAAQPGGSETLLPPPENPLPKPMPTPVVQTVSQPVGPAAPAAVVASLPATDATQAAIGDVGTARTHASPPPPPPPAPPYGAPATRATTAPAAPASQTQAASSRGVGPGTSAAQAPAQTPAQVAAQTRGGGFRIQVGAMRTEPEARAAWEQVRRKHPDILGPMAPSYAKVELGDRGSFFRVQAGPLASRDAARSACERLSKAGTVCFVVPPS